MPSPATLFARRWLIARRSRARGAQEIVSLYRNGETYLKPTLEFQTAYFNRRLGRAS
jgi:hypothetical protein